MDIRRLVYRIADALGPTATPVQIEAVAAAALDALAPSSFPRTSAGEPHALAPELIRRVTLGVSLLDCSSPLPQTVRARVYDKLRRAAAPLAGALAEARATHGLEATDIHLAVTPLSLVADGLARDDLIGLAQVLEQAATDVGADVLSGFSALVDGGWTNGNRAFLASLPAVLAATTRVHASVRCGSATHGIHLDAVRRLADVLLETARHTAGTPLPPCLRLATLYDTAEGRPTGPGARHDPAGPEAALHVSLCADAVLAEAVRQAGPDADATPLVQTLTAVLLSARSAADAVARTCADAVSRGSGIPVRPGSVTLSFAVNGEGAASPAPIALGTLALRRSLMSAVPHDASHAAPYPIPGDVSPESVASYILERLTDGMHGGRPVTLRLVPLPGLPAGASVDWPAPWGRHTVHALPSVAFPYGWRGTLPPA